jgi:hypothetical protein
MLLALSSAVAIPASRFAKSELIETLGMAMMLGGGSGQAPRMTSNDPD